MTIALAIKNALVIATSPKLSMLAGRLSFVPSTLDSSACPLHCPPATLSGLQLHFRGHRTFYYPSSRLLQFAYPNLQTIYLAFYGALPYFRVIAVSACLLYSAEMYGVVNLLQFLLMMDFVFLWGLLNTLRATDCLFFCTAILPLLNKMDRDIPSKKEKGEEKKKMDLIKIDDDDDDELDCDVHSETSTVVEDSLPYTSKCMTPLFDCAIVTLTITMSVLCYAGASYLILSYIQYHALCSINVVLPTELVKLIVGNQICVLATRCLLGKHAPWRSDRREVIAVRCACIPTPILETKPKVPLKAFHSELAIEDAQSKSRSVSLNTLVESDWGKDSEDDSFEYISAEE